MIQLPLDDHYVRYCSPLQFQEGKVLSKAFRLREKDVTTGLSGDHFEYFNFFEGDNYKHLLTALSIRITVKQNGCFSKLKCKTVVNALAHLSFYREDKSSHSFLNGLNGSNFNNEVVPEILVSLISEIRPINSIS
jgi:hypothetical protein